MIDLKKDDGVISLFVLFSLLIFLIFSISTYIVVKNQYKLQDEKYDRIQEFYLKNKEESIYEEASNDEIIPIYNIKQLDIVGTGNYEKIDNKIYKLERANQYILKNNLIVDFNEDIKQKKINANDYKLYSSSYYIDEADEEILYYYNGMYLKNVYYENKAKKVTQENFNENYFNIINQIETGNDVKFVVMVFDKNNDFVIEKNVNQRINNKLTNINQINAYKAIGNISNENKIYVFIEKTINDA